MNVRPPTPLRAAALAALLALGLAACGGPTTPDPTPDPTPTPLALTGVTPDVALPGASVTLTGTGFEDDHEVTFDGLPATVLDATDTTLTVVVPEAYGYPTIAVEEESAEGLVFVGSAYAGATNLDAVQAALDALPTGAALRLPAGTYGAPGTGLNVDNRSLYGSGPTTVLDLDAATGQLVLFARLPHGALLADLAVADGEVQVARGRMTTAQVGDPVPSVPARFERVALDVAAFGTPTPTIGTSVEVVDSSVTTGTATFVVASGALTLDGSVFVVGAPLTMEIIGSTLAVRSTSIEATAVAVEIEAAASPVQLVDVAMSTPGPIQFQSEGAIDVDGAVFDAFDVILLGLQGVAIADSTLAADGGSLVVQTEATVAVHESALTSSNALVVFAGAGVAVTGSDLTSATNDVIIQTGGAVAVLDASLSAATNVAVVGEFGGVSVTDTDVAAAAGAVNVMSYGPVLAEGGTWSAGSDLVLYTEGSAGVALRDAVSVTAGTSLVLADTAGVPLTGSGGTVTFEGNGPTSAAAFGLSGGASDVVVRGNAPITAGAIAINTTAAHIDIHDNASLASLGDLTVIAVGVGARVSATGNAFVADEVAGTILIQSEPGTLTVADNTYLAATVTLVGE